MSAHPPAPAAVDRARSGRSDPTVVAVAEEGLFFVDSIVVGATIMPGFVLCVPALLFMIIPVLAVGLLAAAAGLVVVLAVAPVRVGSRAARRLGHRLAARRAPRERTLPRRPQPVSPSTSGLPADAAMVSAPHALAQEITALPTTRSSSRR